MSYSGVGDGAAGPQAGGVGCVQILGGAGRAQGLARTHALRTSRHRKQLRCGFLAVQQVFRKYGLKAPSAERNGAEGAASAAWYVRGRSGLRARCQARPWGPRPRSLACKCSEACVWESVRWGLDLRGSGLCAGPLWWAHSSYAGEQAWAVCAAAEKRPCLPRQGWLRRASGEPGVTGRTDSKVLVSISGPGHSRGWCYGTRASRSPPPAGQRGQGHLAPVLQPQSPLLSSPCDLRVSAQALPSAGILGHPLAPAVSVPRPNVQLHLARQQGGQAWA